MSWSPEWVPSPLPSPTEILFHWRPADATSRLSIQVRFVNDRFETKQRTEADEPELLRKIRDRRRRPLAGRKGANRPIRHRRSQGHRRDVRSYHADLRGS